MKSTLEMSAELSYRLTPTFVSVACPLLGMHATPQSTAFVMEAGEWIGPDDVELLWDFCIRQVCLFLQRLIVCRA